MTASGAASSVDGKADEGNAKVAGINHITHVFFIQSYPVYKWNFCVQENESPVSMPGSILSST